MNEISKSRSVALAVGMLALSLASLAQETSPIVQIDPSFNGIVASDAKVEKLAGDYGTLEGPLWIRKSGYLIFSEIPANVIHKWDPKDGKVSVFLDKAGFSGADPTGVGAEIHYRDRVFYHYGSNGITMDRQGRIVFVAMGDRQIVRLEKNGKRTVLASEYESRRLNSGNDLVYKSDGSLYFTDPPSGLRNGDKSPLKELSYNGVFLLKDGKLQLLAKDFTAPNGLAFSPDEKILYVNDSAKKTIIRFDVQADDTVRNGRIFIDMTPDSDKAPGVPDGMKVDREGNVYCAGPGGVWVMSPGGRHLGTILTPEIVNNLAFGDDDSKSLYIVARSGLYRIRLKVPGIHP